MASNNIGINAEIIELTLAHQERNAIRRAYNHAKLIPERRALMEQWAGGKIIPIRVAAV